MGKKQARDGSPYAPRTQQLRQKSGCVKHAKMFAKLQQAKSLKVSTSSNAMGVDCRARIAHRPYAQGWSCRSGPSPWFGGAIADETAS
nr:phage virion morphogenesis protein [Xanthomonas euroxanthea]